MTSFVLLLLSVVIVVAVVAPQPPSLDAKVFIVLKKASVCVRVTSSQTQCNTTFSSCMATLCALQQQYSLHGVPCLAIKSIPPLIMMDDPPSQPINNNDDPFPHAIVFSVAQRTCAVAPDSGVECYNPEHCIRMAYRQQEINVHDYVCLYNTNLNCQ